MTQSLGAMPYFHQRAEPRLGSHGPMRRDGAKQSRLGILFDPMDA
jgi:hypothetical protein